jgi:UDP-sugar transporter A1/2/3
MDAPSLWGIPLKYMSLVTLTVQNSSLNLLMAYSRQMPIEKDQPRYLASTAVLLNELIKLVVCTSMALYTQGFSNTKEETFSPDSWKLAIPAFLYTLQNTLQYLAVSNLDAATFQVTYQLKIITTAIFSVTLLRRSLTGYQWFSLFLLTVGIALVQLPAETFTGSSSASSSAAAVGMNSVVGFGAVLVACVLSGLAGVYFEKVLKGSKGSVWTRNIQLSFFSLFPAFFLGVLVKDGSQIQKDGFFQGYNGVVWSTIFCQALGGVIVALCVKFADNIAKNFATSISILISFVASIYLFEFIATVNFIVGAMVVIFATYLYSKPSGFTYKEVSKEEETRPTV